MRLIVAACVALATLAGGLVASGQAQGAEARSGALSTPSPPQPNDVRCADRCAGLRAVAQDSAIVVTGRRLGEVQRIGVKGRQGAAWTNARQARGQSVAARIPRDAARGRTPVVVENTHGQRSRARAQLTIVAPSQIPSSARFRLTSAELTERRVYFDNHRSQRLEAMFTASEPVDVRVEFARAGSGQVVRSQVIRGAQPNRPLQTSWNGIADNGRVAPSGRYVVRIGPVSSGNGETSNGLSFRFFDHTFPVRANGNHNWGDGMGAGRGHQGQDIFARCGVPIVAARGGRVIQNQFHGAAGFYVTIRGTRTNREYVYAHLRERSPLRPGSRVRTGQRIGRNGETGNASGCHLHFELWRGGAWTGQVLDPTPHLRRWERWG